MSNNAAVGRNTNCLIFFGCGLHNIMLCKFDRRYLGRPAPKKLNVKCYLIFFLHFFKYNNTCYFPEMVDITLRYVNRTYVRITPVIY